MCVMCDIANAKKYKERLKQAIKDLKSEAQYIGEDGDMAVICKTELGALRKFKKITRETCGEEETEDIKMENIGIGWLHLVTESTQDKFGEDTEWYIDYEKKSPWEVFVHSY